MENEVRIQTADGEMPTFVAHPDTGGPFPVAVLYMDGVGYREQIKENARRFAAAGYYCVAPDLYYRAGEGIHFDLSNMEAERERMMKVASTVKPEKVVEDTKAVFAAVAPDPAAEPGPKDPPLRGQCNDPGQQRASRSGTISAGGWAHAQRGGALISTRPELLGHRPKGT